MIKKPSGNGTIYGFAEYILTFVRFNIGTKLIFFIIGIALWFNINLQKEFETTVNIPIIMSNIQQGKTLLNSIPEEARVKIRSKGRYLITSGLNKDIFFEIDASSLPDSSTFRLSNDFFVNTSGKELEPLFIFYPQEVVIQFDNYETRKVPIILNTQFTLAPGYLTSGKFMTNPDSVTITGPQSKVRKINQIFSVKSLDKDLTKDYSKKIHLLLRDSSSVKYSQQTVEVYQQIVRKGVNSFKAPVRILNKPENTSILIDPIAIDINVIGPVNELQNIGADDFIVTADASELDNTTNKISLKVSTTVNIEWNCATTEVRAIRY
ncbi:MAG: hypothetical protein KKD38_02585 [Candidatus Delongbacteria bacterium]|nr:hypothetical protein [Candidatus Delongbacteria bacterium]